MSKKAVERKTPVENSTNKDKADVLLNELGTIQVSETFRAALTIHSYAPKDHHTIQEFRITFSDMNCLIIFRNSGSNIQLVL